MKWLQINQNMTVPYLDNSNLGLSILIHTYAQFLRQIRADIDSRALIPLLLLTCLSGNAYALSCAQPKLDKAKITKSVAIFEGVAGNKHDLSWRQKASVKKDKLIGKFAGVENLSVYEFRVTKNWKGAVTDQTVKILFNTTWGDNYLPGSKFLIVSPQKISEMYWTPLCGNSIDLEWARKNGDLELLKQVIVIGD